jgi:hypothetical protein
MLLKKQFPGHMYYLLIFERLMSVIENYEFIRLTLSDPLFYLWLSVRYNSITINYF